MAALAKLIEAPIEYHGHNDLGLAVANTLAAARGGARAVSVTVGGLGERAGNAALEQVAAGLPIFCGLDCGVDLVRLPAICASVAKASGRPIPVDRPIVGGAVFSHESGIHVDGILKDPALYEFLRPETFGRSRSIVPGIRSGRSALVHCAGPIGPRPARRQSRLRPPLASEWPGPREFPWIPGWLSRASWTRRAVPLKDKAPGAFECAAAPRPFCDGVLPLFYELARTIALGRELQGVMDAAVKVIVENLIGAERVVLSILDRRTGAAS